MTVPSSPGHGHSSTGAFCSAPRYARRTRQCVASAAAPRPRASPAVETTRRISCWIHAISATNEIQQQTRNTVSMANIHPHCSTAASPRRLTRMRSHLCDVQAFSVNACGTCLFLFLSCPISTVHGCHGSRASIRYLALQMGDLGCQLGRLSARHACRLQRPHLPAEEKTNYAA